MGSKSLYLSNALLNYVMNGTAFSSPSATKYMMLIRATRGYSNNIRSSAVAVNDTVCPATPNGRLYVCTAQTGNTGAGEPTWPTTAGGTVSDGNVTWTEMTNYFEASTPDSRVTNAEVANANNYCTTNNRTSAGAFTNSTTGSLSNSADINFNTPSGPWGLCVMWAICTGQAYGSPTALLYWGALATPQSPDNGNTVRIASGQLTITDD